MHIDARLVKERKRKGCKQTNFDHAALQAISNACKLAIFDHASPQETSARRKLA